MEYRENGTIEKIEKIEKWGNGEIEIGKWGN